MKLLKTLIAAFYLLFTSARAALADDISDAVGRVNPNAVPFTNLGSLIGNLLQLVYYVAGLFFFIYFLIGGLQWITSGGDKGGVQAARDKIVNAVIGLILVVAAYAITLIIETVLGIKILTGFRFRGP